MTVYIFYNVKVMTKLAFEEHRLSLYFYIGSLLSVLNIFTIYWILRCMVSLFLKKKNSSLAHATACNQV